MGIATNSPRRCIPKNANAAQPAGRTGGSMNAPTSSRYTGTRAEQDMSGATRIVARRLLGSGITRAAMMPGMAQANDDSSGMNARPLRPHQPSSRSIRNAARAR